MRVPDPILASAVFLCVKKDGVMTPAGTGFVLEVDSAWPDATWHHRYLVTARHCIENAKRYGALYLRVNPLGEGDPVLIKLPSAWEYHRDETNDVAVLPYPGPPIHEVMLIERDALATWDVVAEKSIGIGEDLLVVGLFARHHGETRNHPIVRTGSIAAMPYEQIRDPHSGLGFHAYLAEVRSIGGLSGSPVWAVLFPSRMLIKPQGAVSTNELRFYLLGLIRGHWEKEEEWLSDFGETETESLNTGIAMVTPIQIALDIIDGSEELARDRKRRDKELATRDTRQVPDSAG
jgi:hypothetical protein